MMKLILRPEDAPFIAEHMKTCGLCQEIAALSSSQVERMYYSIAHAFGLVRRK